MKLRFWEVEAYTDSRLKMKYRRDAQFLSSLAMSPVTILRIFTKAKPPIPKPKDFDPFSQGKRTDRKRIRNREDLYQLGVSFSRK